MSATPIRVENLGKKYVITHKPNERYIALRDVLTNKAKALCQGLISLSNHRQAKGTEDFWALKDVSFEVKQGEVVGIIGPNGAGKSTLLKILSRITEPTTGTVRLEGRLASLLEVGTGFHPELTGRENIFLNGAILGMKRAEIKRRFAEIVAFAEIEKFLDTPVKRYSSGMYVRLAFAVAAHLEPELLLIDEVLAVGDASFQRKCLGKLEDVAREGRTVLFVSHNIPAVRSMCERSILLREGNLSADGKTSDILATYLFSNAQNSKPGGEISWNLKDAPGGKEIRLHSVRLKDRRGQARDLFEPDEPISVEISYTVFQLLTGMRLILSLKTDDGVLAFSSTNHASSPATLKPGRYVSSVVIPPGLLNRKRYVIQLHAGIPGIKVLINCQDLLVLTCVGGSNHGSNFPETWPGIFAPRLEWSIENLNDTLLPKDD